MRTILTMALALVLLAPCASMAGQACTCADAKAHNGWCDACAVGYVAGVKIESEDLFEALDAHGHHIDPAKLRCDSCEKALETGGYCEQHRIGFVDGLAYLSPLTYLLARGELEDPGTIACPVCRKNAETHGWCSSCKRGMIGRIAIEDRRDFARASGEYRRLLSAVEISRRCGTCAAAMILDGACPFCEIKYKDGKKLPPDSPTEP